MMVAIAIGSLALLRPTLKFTTPYALRRIVPGLALNLNRTITSAQFTGTTTTSKTDIQTPAMEQERAAVNPMPALAKADPTGEAPEKLPKLSAADFQTYNRLAVMMDYYVSTATPTTPFEEAY